MIEIKETTKQDLPDVRRLWADGEVMKFVGFPEGLKQTPQEMEEWLNRIEKNRPRVNHYSIFEDGKYCGESFYAINKENKRASLDIKLFPFSRGKGIASQALLFAIEQAFANGATSAYVDPNPKNEKALALYHRIGMIEKPIPQDLLDPDCEQVYFEVTKEDYKKIKPRLTLQTNPLLPFYAEDSEILILGSFPSVKSRDMKFYYGHPQNRFWKVLAKIYGEEVPEHNDIETKKSFLLRHKIALWDVVATCKIKGSSDPSIKDAEYNNIADFVENQAQNIGKILINGTKALKYYENLPQTPKIANFPVPSTSPANARWTLEKLADAWKEALTK